MGFARTNVETLRTSLYPTSSRKDQEQFVILNRRRFLSLTGTSAAALIFPALRRAFPEPLGLPAGIQLYAIRDELTKDTPGTLKALLERSRLFTILDFAKSNLQASASTLLASSTSSSSTQVSLARAHICPSPAHRISPPSLPTLTR